MVNTTYYHHHSTFISESGVIKYKKKAIERILLRCIHHFESDLINKVDHMRILDNEPLSVVLSQTKCFQKLKMTAQKCLKTEAQRDGVINLQDYNFKKF